MGGTSALKALVVVALPLSFLSHRFFDGVTLLKIRAYLVDVVINFGSSPVKIYLLSLCAAVKDAMAQSPFASGFAHTSSPSVAEP